MNKKYSPYFFTQEELPVFDLDQIYLISSIWHDEGMKDVWGTFDLLVRDMPKHRNFLVFTGLEEMVLAIKNWRFNKEQINLLKKEKLISPKFAKYLKNFKFTGDIYAMKEGSIFFQGEPVVRITAPLVEANLFTAFLLTSLASNSIYSSKFVRSQIAARNKNFIGPGPQRAPGFETSLKAQRASYIIGSKEIPSPVVRKLFNIASGDSATIAYHAFVKSFPSEIDAFMAAAKNAKVDLSVMVDTYNIKEGVKNAIKTAKWFFKENKNKYGFKVVVDSGDLEKLCKYTRHELDKDGLKKVKIVAAGNLDEYKIKRLLDKKTPADSFIVATEGITSSDSPKMEAVCKISEIITKGKKEYKMKLSTGKVSLPGRKQVYRLYKKGKLYKDIIGLEGEKSGQPLLAPIFKKGKLIYKLPQLDKIREYSFGEIKKLPKRLLEIEKDSPYKIELSPKLKKLIKEVKNQIILHL